MTTKLISKNVTKTCIAITVVGALLAASHAEARVQAMSGRGGRLSVNVQSRLKALMSRVQQRSTNVKSVKAVSKNKGRKNRFGRAVSINNRRPHSNKTLAQRLDTAKSRLTKLEAKVPGTTGKKQTVLARRITKTKAKITRLERRINSTTPPTPAPVPLMAPPVMVHPLFQTAAPQIVRPRLFVK